MATINSVRSAAEAAQFELKCGTTLPVDHPAIVRMAEMWTALEEDSGGRIHTQFFPNSLLGTQAAMLSQVRLGALQFILLDPTSLASIVPTVDICSLGFAYKDSDEGLRCMDGPLGRYLRDAVGTKGLYALNTVWNSGMSQVAAGAHPIRTPDDLRGFKIRVPESRILVDLFKALGASPTPLSANEIYTALQTKIIDGTASQLAVIEASRFYEVQKYVSLTNHAWNGPWLIAGGDTWKSLPIDLQATIERVNTKYALLGRRDSKALDASITAKLRSQGVLTNTVDQAPFRARLRPYFEFWANAFGPTAWGLLQTSLGHRLV
jgi:TRAP-type transport system periplasmic protein